MTQSLSCILGMDSLLAVRLRAFILQLLKKAGVPNQLVPRNLVYDYPTISSLADYITGAISSLHSDPTSADAPSIASRVSALVDRYTSNLNERTWDASEQGDGLEYVVITGTTGSLGSFLLDQLLRRASVARVYCLNRKSDEDTVDRQLHGFRDKGIDTTLLEEANGKRAFFYDVDLSLPDLGLAKEDYEKVSVDFEKP